MTHRDGFPRLSARSAWRSDAGHRKPGAPSQSHGPSESLGKPPFRSRRRSAGGRRKALTMSRIACGFPPARPLARRIARAISMGQPAQVDRKGAELHRPVRRACAVLDVFEEEPLSAAAGARFAGLPNLILTPHVAGLTGESNHRLSAVTVESVLRVLNLIPRNVDNDP